MPRHLGLGAASLVGSLLASAIASGQTPVPSLDLRGYRASTDPNAGLYLEPADSPGSGDWNAGFIAHYAFRPVSLRDPTTNETAFHVINHQITGDFVAGIGFAHRLFVGLDIPFLAFQTGDAPTADVTR